MPGPFAAQLPARLPSQTNISGGFTRVLPLYFEKGIFMSFSFGFISNDSALVQCTLAPFATPLTIEQGAPHGWGMAYYQVGRPLLKKQPKPFEGPLDFSRTAARLRSNMILGHIRDATVGGQRTENTHPFRYRSWTFCHSGTVDRFPEVEEDLLKSVPDFIRRNIRGKTDSENIFHLFLSFLNDTGKLDDPRIPPREVARALHSTISYLNRLVVDRGGEALSGCIMITNGNFIVAARLGMEVKVTRQSSFDCRDSEGKPVSADHLKAVVVIGGTPPATPGWELVADGAVLVVDRDLNIETISPD